MDFSKAMVHDQVSHVTATTLLVLLLTSCSTVCPCFCQTYQQALSVIDDKLVSSNYNTVLRPLKNQSHVMKVYVDFYLGYIVEVNEVSQSIVCNGFFALKWFDEILAWTPSDYGGLDVINPQPKQIWRPRMVLTNTLGDRDMFQDDSSPVLMSSNGETVWFPGSLIPMSCTLDMTKHPFDQHLCSMLISFIIKRRSTFLVLNILLPVVLLSALNLLVFHIPVDSGEKISYGITVLLSLSVYMSTISGMLPRSSDNIPSIVIYLFLLFVISVLTVIASVVIAFLHNLEMQEEHHNKMKKKFQKLCRKGLIVQKAFQPMSKDTPDSKGTTEMSDKKPKEAWLKPRSFSPDVFERMGPEEEEGGIKGEGKTSCEQDRNYYKMIGKHIDMTLFVVFSFIWTIATTWFFIQAAV